MNMKNVSRYVIFIGLWSVLLIPFYVATSMFFPFISGKNFAFRIIIEIMFALWVYLAYIDVKYRPKLSWLLKTIGIFVIVMLIADIFAVNPMKALWSNYERMDGWVTIIHMFMYFLVLGSMMKAEKIWLWFFRSSVAMSVIMFIIAIGEYSSGGPTNTMTTLGNTIYVAVYFLFNFFFTLILLYKDVIVKSAGTLASIFSKWLTYVYLIAAILFAYGVWITGTRGAILGLIGGLIMTAVIIIIFEKENKIMKKLSVALIVAIVIVVGGFFAVKNTQFVKKNSILNSFAVISWNSINGQGQAKNSLSGRSQSKVFLKNRSSAGGRKVSIMSSINIMIQDCIIKNNGLIGLTTSRSICLLPGARSGFSHIFPCLSPQYIFCGKRKMCSE